MRPVFLFVPLLLHENLENQWENRNCWSQILSDIVVPRLERGNVRDGFRYEQEE